MVATRRTQPASKGSAQPYTVKAPIGGLNTVSPGLDMPELDCSYVVNLMAADNGLRSRLGYREWAKNLTGVGSNEVRSILAFTGSQPTNGRLFGVTNSGIYDVSASSASPPKVATFPNTLGRAGYGMSTVMVTAAGYFLVYCDEVNGTWVYSESGGAWAQVTVGTGPGQISGSGVDPNSFVMPISFKNRLWFVVKSSGDAWYLPVGQVFGAAVKFPFGPNFRKGGSLVGLWSWTYDGGAGMDDSLVAVSTGGDVLVYQGPDPASASTFGLKGTWYIGPPPLGRRIGTSTGGELLLLSRQGLVPMSKLVLGAVTSAEYATAKVSSYLNALMSAKAELDGWAVVQSPEDGVLLALVPRGTSTSDAQIAQALTSPLRPWFPYEGLPMLSADAWTAKLFFGTRTGRVCVHTGYVDNVLLGSATSTPVRWALVSGFSSLGSPRQKQVHLLRPLVIADSKGPAVNAEARYEFDKGPALPGVYGAAGRGTWGVARWGVDRWSGNAVSTYKPLSGGVGMGVAVAVAVSGRAASRTVLMGVDVTFSAGGFL